MILGIVVNSIMLVGLTCTRTNGIPIAIATKPTGPDSSRARMFLVPTRFAVTLNRIAVIPTRFVTMSTRIATILTWTAPIPTWIVAIPTRIATIRVGITLIRVNFASRRLVVTNCHAMRYGLLLIVFRQLHESCSFPMTQNRRRT